MEQVFLPNLEMVHLKHKGNAWLGGSQYMFEEYWRRMSGCGPTTASTQLAYQALADPRMRDLFPHAPLTGHAMLDFMNTMWNFITPSVQGVDNTRMFVAGAREYGEQIGLPLRAHVLDINPKGVLPTREELKNWLTSELSLQRPVAFLVLDSGQVANLQNWHWTLLVGITSSKESLQATLYDEGRLRVVDLALWLGTTKKAGGFVTFSALEQ